jgi:hypothetical protein
MSNDIVARLRAEIAWEAAVGELLSEAASEIERLRLTDAEREAVDYARRMIDNLNRGDPNHAATLRGLLERTTPSGKKSPTCSDLLPNGNAQKLAECDS